MATIGVNLQAVRQRVADAARACGRDPATVGLIAVSKTFGADAVAAAHASGQCVFGENYVQEALDKIAALAGTESLEWHFIGPIQSNKTRQIAENFAWVHSVDRAKIAERLSAARPATLAPLQVCIQINIGEENTKSGVAPAAALALARAVSALPRLKLRGLMAIPPASDDLAQQRRYFAELRKLKEQLATAGVALDTLSMGMSADLEAAIAEGATLVRVGTAIFGARQKHLAQINPYNSGRESQASVARNDMTITFIGGGNMANAIIGGLLKKGYAANQLRVVEIDATARARLAQQYAIATCESIDAAAVASDCVVLAIKPQNMREVATALRPHIKQQLVISIAAGIRGTDLARWLGGYARIVRAMPNTPALVGAGCTGLYAMPGATKDDAASAEAILGAVGTTLIVASEEQLDAITAVSGSGPAYVFYFIEALQQAALDLGLAPDAARRLAIETFVGAVKLAAESPEDAATLRARVTSKGGTTAAALASMQAARIKEAIVSAVKAANERSRELGTELGKDG